MAQSRPKHWRDFSGVQKYAFIQSEVLFLTLYVVAAVLIAVNVGVGPALVVFGGSLLLTGASIAIGLRLRRSRRRGPRSDPS